LNEIKLTVQHLKSGSKRIFTNADVNIPIGAHDIYDESELIQTLAKLISANIDQNEWLVKVWHFVVVW